MHGHGSFFVAPRTQMCHVSPIGVPPCCMRLSRQHKDLSGANTQGTRYAGVLLCYAKGQMSNILPGASEEVHLSSSRTWWGGVKPSSSFAALGGLRILAAVSGATVGRMSFSCLLEEKALRNLLLCLWGPSLPRAVFELAGGL